MDSLASLWGGVEDATWVDFLVGRGLGPAVMLPPESSRRKKRDECGATTILHRKANEEKKEGAPNGEFEFDVEKAIQVPTNEVWLNSLV